VILIGALLYVSHRYKAVDWRNQFRARYGILYETYRPTMYVYSFFIPPVREDVRHD
jgi:hypothetical protein